MRAREMTQPIEPVDSPDDNDASAVVPMSAEVSARWNSWLERALEYHLFDEQGGAFGLGLMKAVNLAIANRVGPLEAATKQIDELRLQVAHHWRDRHPPQQGSAGCFRRPETGNPGPRLATVSERW